MTVALAVCTHRLPHICPYLKLSDHFAIEHRKISRFAARYNSVVNHYLLIHPVCSGIAQIRFYRRPGGHGSSTYHIRVHQHPRSMANCRDRFLFVDKGLDELDSQREGTKMVRVNNSTGK